MRATAIAIILGLAMPGAAMAQQEGSGSSNSGLQHPAEVALVDEGDLGSVYRHFPSGLRLYTTESDPPGESTCYGGCASAWPPLTANDQAVDTGDWTILERTDGRRQWMLKGQPVYVRYHDTPTQPTGDGVDGVWHLVPYQPKVENPSAAELDS